MKGTAELGFLKYLETPANTENSKISKQKNIQKSNVEKPNLNESSKNEIKMKEPVEEKERKKAHNEEEEDFMNITPIPALTDNHITDDTLIYYHKGLPIYLDFLHINDSSKASEGVISYFEKIKPSLTLRKWGSMKEKDKIYYLYNKIQYYNNLIEIKETSKNKFESMIESKNKEIKNLQELIYEKELQYEKSGNNNQVDIMKKKENIEKLEKQISEFPAIIAELDEKIKNCDQLIQNYENPSDGQPITEIIEGLKEEKKRLKSEIAKQNEILVELDERVKQLNESVKILEMKSTPNKTNNFINN